MCVRPPPSHTLEGSDRGGGGGTARRARAPVLTLLVVWRRRGPHFTSGVTAARDTRANLLRGGSQPVWPLGEKVWWRVLLLVG